MKKTIISMACIIVLGLSLTACGKKAEPMVLPYAEEIRSIEVSNGIDDIICTDKDVIASFIQKISEARATSKKSVQDVPNVSEYTRVDLVQDGKLTSIFIYQENSKWYIEQAYQGIYETDENILDLLMDSLN